MAVSVTIPVRNGAKTLAACLKSVLRQTIDDFEVIIVDNGSTDDTKKIVEAAMRKDPRVRYVHERRQGRAAARNRCLKEARNDIVAMTDDDCVVPRDWLERLTAPIATGEEEAAMGFEEPIRKNYWTRSVQRLHRHNYWLYKEGSRIRVLDTKNFAMDKRKVTLRFDERFKRCEDTDWMLTYGRAVRFLPSLRVKHHHPSTFGACARIAFCQGMWTRTVQRKHQGTYEEQRPAYWLMKPINLGSAILQDPKKGFFLTVWEGMWGLGYLWRMLGG